MNREDTGKEWFLLFYVPLTLGLHHQELNLISLLFTASLPLILKGRVSMWEASFEFMSDERSVCGLLFTAPLGSFGAAVFLTIISFTS